MTQIGKILVTLPVARCGRSAVLSPSATGAPCSQPAGFDRIKSVHIPWPAFTETDVSAPMR